jgi:diadenosine tetraphosphate (Ap4A) HIT family hydrolase/5-methylcytosine-specific restriction endonuclease McrA
MTFEDLVDYIGNRMRMSHIYQPVMLMELLSNNGTLKDSEVAKAILVRDPSQVEYYTNITNNMVGRVLRNNSVVTRDRTTKCFSLVGFGSLNDEQIETLKHKCLERLEAYLDSRDPFGHRRKSSGYISGSIRYQVLKRAKFHCELCGISAEEKALEIDHILPRNCGGSDELSNLQALCYSCNSMKRDTNDTDFRAVRESYKHRESDCLFCNPEKERILAENELAYVFADGFPVTEGHVLIIPKRHVANYFELGQAEINACTSLLNEQQELSKQNDASIEGFNIGVNVGEAAGQTIMHCHIHLIPRRQGDVEDPIGGVRNTIPGKGNYRKATI